MAQQELEIIQDFMLWMIRHIEKFPRHHRYSLGIISTMKDLKNMKKGEC